MKRVFTFMLALAMVLSLCACGGSKAETSVADTPTWQEQYDLGVKYLSEGNYEEAIIAFELAIQIEPKRAEAYIGLADVYTAQGNASMAVQILNQGKEAVGETDELLQAIANARTVRRDMSDGEWIINEYDETGKQILSTWYLADGSVKSISEYTYEGDTYTILTQKYNNPDSEVYQINVYDASNDRLLESTACGKPIPIDEHHNGSEDHFKYDYHGTHVTVTYDAYTWTVNGKESDGSDVVTYEMAAPENYVLVGWHHNTGWRKETNGVPASKITGITEYSPSHGRVNEVSYE